MDRTDVAHAPSVRHRPVAPTLRFGQAAAALLFLVPALLLLAGFRIVPMVQAAYYSLTSWNGIGEPRWVGLANYEALLNDSTFRTTLLNHVAILLALPIWVFLPLVLAVLIQPLPGARIYRVALFLPAVMSPVIIGAFFGVMLRYDGPVNEALSGLGLDGLRQEWLFNPATAMPVTIAILIWAATGIGVVIYLGALSNVDEELYDAARVDGASWYRLFRHVTVPQVRPTIEFWTVLVFISTVTAQFPFIYSLTQGGPGNSTYVAEYYIYDKAFIRGAPGYASAIGVVLSVVLIALAGAQILLFRRGESGAR
jgi:ABC-type sugar transport system permease subunit